MGDTRTGRDPDPEQIVQQAAAQYLAASNAPGCCIAVYDEQSLGTTGLVHPLGLSAVAGSTPPPFAVTVDTVFELGSVTKVFTATLLAVAVKAGAATLEDPVGGWLNHDGGISPDPVGSDVLKAIQLQQFATHTSGMPEQPDGVSDYSQPLFADASPTPATIQWWNAYDTPPPGCWQYSNIGFVTLGFAVTQMFPLPGVQYDTILDQQVTGPLGMPRTGASVDRSWPAAQGCIGHWTEENGVAVFQKNVPTGGSAFDLKSTGDDMLVFMKAQIGPPSGLLGLAIQLTQQSQGSFRICGGAGSVTMGLAWQITSDARGNAVFTKNGATSRGGFEAVVIVVPALKCGVAVLSNQYFDASGVHPKGIAPGATALGILAQLHPGFALAEPLPDPDVSS